MCLGKVHIHDFLYLPQVPYRTLGSWDSAVLGRAVVGRRPQQGRRRRGLSANSARESIFAELEHLGQDDLCRIFNGRAVRRPCLHPEHKLHLGACTLLGLLLRRICCFVAGRLARRLPSLEPLLFLACLPFSEALLQSLFLWALLVPAMSEPDMSRPILPDVRGEHNRVGGRLTLISGVSRFDN